MWMLVMIMATSVSLSSTLFRPDITITPDLIWPDKAACDVVREAHLSKHPPPDHAGLICLRVPDAIAKKYLPSKPPIIDAGAQEMRCGTHADTMGYLKDSEGQTIVWEGWSLNGYHIRLYQNSSDNRWTTTVDRHVNIDYECVYSKGSAGSSSPINYDSET
jgi:hypothetical protein|tara:strand:+ start:1279 stop:1761 length:483 start_codon:yes stop_codon:yes gene_type:complete